MICDMICDMMGEGMKGAGGGCERVRKRGGVGVRVRGRMRERKRGEWRGGEGVRE